MKRQSLWRRELIRAVAMKMKTFWDASRLTNSYRHFGKSAACVRGLSIHEEFVFNCFRVWSLWWKMACVKKALGLLVPSNQRLQLNKCNVYRKYIAAVRHSLVNLRMCSLITLFQFYFYRRHFQFEIDHKRLRSFVTSFRFTGT
jgi:hypothetical protein